MDNNLHENFIKLPNDIYDNLDISNEELVLLILLYRNYMQYKSISWCSIEVLCNYLYINSNTNKRIYAEIKRVISLLIEKKYINQLYDLHYQEIGINDIKNKHCVFYVGLISPPEINYFMIKDIDIDNILKYLQGVNIDKFSFIRYFVACSRVMNNDFSFGYLTQAKLKQLINHSTTIQRYNKILQDELKLIKYNNNYLTPEKRYCTTFIGSFNNELFNEMVSQEVEQKGLIPTDKVVSNKKRSIKQKINNNEKQLKVNKNIELEEENRRLKEQLEALQYKSENRSQSINIPESVRMTQLEDIDNNTIPESLRLTQHLMNEDENEGDESHIHDKKDNRVTIMDVLNTMQDESCQEIKRCFVCRNEYIGCKDSQHNLCPDCSEEYQRSKQRASKSRVQYKNVEINYCPDEEDKEMLDLSDLWDDVI